MKKIKIGDKVQWIDACIYDYTEDDREFQQSRTYEVISINGDVITIADDYGDAEVFEHEIEPI